jgi:hypothetical protein
MKRISENGARPVIVPGGPLAQPFGRLGALVFQPNNTDTIMLGEPAGSDPDSRLCHWQKALDTRWENVLIRNPQIHGSAGPSAWHNGGEICRLRRKIKR